MENVVLINIKPSQRVMASFRRTFPEAQYGGSSSLGSKSKCYYLPVAIYEQNKEEIKKFGSKSKHQPFL